MLAIVPRPTQLQNAAGFFALSRATTIGSDDARADDAIRWFRGALFQLSGVRLQESAAPDISLRAQDDMAPESYALRVAPDAVEIRAANANGFLYGLVTLLQCVPLEAPGAPDAPGTWRLPALQIRDAPRFGWRGMMLDSARHFQSVEWVKKFVDALALHKFNVLHWHLTDDQGWRIEIDKYPALTNVSAWRKGSRVGHEIGSAPDAFDGRPHGGFYSKSELREVVQYAAARGITVVPEIELPGHASAVLAAYPELSCAGGPFEVETRWGIFDDVYCAGNDQTLRFLENVLTEVLEIFPSQFIHVGGDECHKTRWKECPKCQARIQAEELAGEDELQSWMVRHFDRFLERARAPSNRLGRDIGRRTGERRGGDELARRSGRHCGGPNGT